MPFILEPSHLFYHIGRLQRRYSIFLEAMKPHPGHGCEVDRSPERRPWRPWGTGREGGEAATTSRTLAGTWSIVS